MIEAYNLNIKVRYHGITATIIGRCYAGEQWLYDLRTESGELINYVPHDRLRGVA
jgi:hypothetical protein